MSEDLAPSERSALVVDDYLDSATALTRMLRSLGWKTEMAFDGIHALKKAGVLKPSLIFLDISMPKLDGFDTCGVVRAQPWASATRLIAVTGLPVDEVSERVKQVGFDAFLQKPVDFDDLARIAGTNDL